jgi:protein-tyrosine phosphatase
MEEAAGMASALRSLGFDTVYCTPHLIKGAFDVGNEVVREAVSLLQGRLDMLRIDVRLLPGREYYLDEFLPDYLDDLLPLGETPYLLLEIPNHSSPDFVIDICRRVAGSGRIPMIAHPERCRLFDFPEDRNSGWFKGFFRGERDWGRHTGGADPSRARNGLIDALRELGCCFQGNLGSPAGLYGGRVRQSFLKLRERDIFTHFGSDLHSTESIRFIADMVQENRQVKEPEQ